MLPMPKMPQPTQTSLAPRGPTRLPPMQPPETSQQQDEGALVERFQQGDRQAFSALVLRHQRTVFGLAWRYVRNEEDAKDLTQAVFVKAWQAAAQFRGESSLRTWLCRITVHLALNWLRDHGKRQGVELREEWLPPSEPLAWALDEAETANRLRQAVGTLPDKQRMAVELRVHEGMSFREIGEAAGCSEDAAKANFHHGLKKLKTLMGTATK
jgi:RNA polymerase sigma-70 factor (ECF subfamily)